MNVVAMISIIITLIDSVILLIRKLLEIIKVRQKKTESDSPEKKSSPDQEKAPLGDSVKLSELTENSTKYFDQIEKSIPNFFKTAALAIPMFTVILLCDLLFNKVAAAPFYWIFSKMKCALLSIIIETKANFNASLAVILSVISSFYYLRILKIMQ